MSVSSASGIPDEDAWFHDNISREDAETMLTDFGEEGAFLVRESASSPGDYAISVFSNNVVHHIQVKRHGEDAFFSVEDREPCHGLDELIRFLQSPESPDDEIFLQKPIIKSFPPADVRRHGRTNLLHRATKERSVQIVSEMLNCKNRSIDAKNEIGQTATHLASIHGFGDILLLLIKSTKNNNHVNAKDSASCTPLHYACRYNHPDIVHILLNEGDANPQIRRNDNGWVPMHEAASLGHLKCIEVLYLHGAPLRPRTTLNDIPLHLSIKEKHFEAVKFFDTVQPHEPVTKRDDWFHNKLGRKDALDLLRGFREYCEIDSLASYYLIRCHSVKEDAYVLTIVHGYNSYNFEIWKEGNFLYIDDGPYLESLEHLVQHYSRWPDGLPCRLQVPVSKAQAKSLKETPNISSPKNSLDVPPPLPKRTPRSNSPNPLNTSLKNDVENNNGFTPSYSKENIPIEALEIGEIVGEGEYGEVYRGMLRQGLSAPAIAVAIKTLKSEGEMSEWKKNEFLTEARTMLDLEHEHIVKIIGICWSPKTYMVQELCELGSLHDYLLDHADDINPAVHFRLWAHQIAKGMRYLQRKRFIHRDLAVRNILLSSVLVAKISDFGLSRALGCDSDYYTASKGGRWPIKWYAPESCTHGTFSHATDVWSYGITLWEIYSYGASPYGDLPGKEVIDMVENGYRLEKPEHCPDQIYSVMKMCWSEKSELRPTFHFLENFFADCNGNETDTQSPSSSNTSSRNNSVTTTVTNIPIPLLPPPPPSTRVSESKRKNNETEDDIVAEVSLMSFD